MARKYVAFDIETAKDVPDFVNWRAHRPLGISCAAALLCDAASPVVWHGRTHDGNPARQMSAAEARSVVDQLVKWVADGYTLLTWNGLSFDLNILSEESDAQDACRTLAKNHVDMMFHVFCELGYPVAIEKAAQAMGIPGKPQGMSGILAPQLWAQGQYQKVIDYVSRNVKITLGVAQIAEKHRSFKWITRKGTISSMELARGWLAVQDARRLPSPDTSWMTSPLPRGQFTGWVD